MPSYAPFIDRTYFQGELTIGQVETDVVAAELSLYIRRYEFEFLTKLLGKTLFDAWYAGMKETSPADEWMRMSYGNAFILDQSKVVTSTGVDALGRVCSIPRYRFYDSMNVHYKGLLKESDTAGNVEPGNIEELTAVVGRGQTYDPSDGSNTFTHPLIAGKFIASKQGFGLLSLGIDYEKTGGNTIRLLNGITFSDDEVFQFVFFKASSSIDAGEITGFDTSSPIAKYIYYWWHRHHATHSGGVGEIVPAVQNGTIVNNNHKMAIAYNEMCQEVFEFYLFLDQNIADYPEFDLPPAARFCPQPINEFNFL